MAKGYGSFPVTGPVTYLTDDPLECQRLMEVPLPRHRIAGRTWAWVGTVHLPRYGTSRGGISKTGSPLLRILLVEAAMSLPSGTAVPSASSMPATEGAMSRRRTLVSS